MAISYRSDQIEHYFSWSILISSWSYPELSWSFLQCSILSLNKQKKKVFVHLSPSYCQSNQFFFFEIISLHSNNPRTLFWVLRKILFFSSVHPEPGTKLLLSSFFYNIINSVVLGEGPLQPKLDPVFLTNFSLLELIIFFGLDIDCSLRVRIKLLLISLWMPYF